MRNRIKLRGLTAIGYHGVLPEERRDGQPFVVDLTLWVPPPTRDDVAETVNYAEVSERVVDLIAGQPFDLIENLAAHIAEDVMSNYAKVSKVKVTVHKPDAPITVDFADVSVSVTRRK